ncbi:DUF1289 domain-containing protein [Pelagibius sp. Alg239-R121]|uniref:DUF1289 domain-containing protein n=1 Tax=Pelagibius sp. Alg239-R121 TaxID=2993448 RepID=UPI0024A6AC3C|nr:DUF1289 domain-containing protein [Pelagibius sp. Alg239-R121]
MSESQDTERAARRARRRQARLRGLDRSVPSPCISVCQLDDASGLCIGCHRNVDEIRDWPILSADEKRAVLAEIETRGQKNDP